MGKNGGKPRRATSGAAGGPGASAGFNYQVDFAVFQTLESISSAFANPLEERTISMEPRVTDGNAVTCWDVRISPPATVTEAKSRPKRDELLQWLDYVESASSQTEDLQFELFYGRGAPAILNAIDRLAELRARRLFAALLIFGGTQLPCKFVPAFLEKASFLASSCQVF